MKLYLTKLIPYKTFIAIECRLDGGFQYYFAIVNNDIDVIIHHEL